MSTNEIAWPPTLESRPTKTDSETDYVDLILCTQQFHFQEKMHYQSNQSLVLSLSVTALNTPMIHFLIQVIWLSGMNVYLYIATWWYWHIQQLSTMSGWWQPQYLSLNLICHVSQVLTAITTEWVRVLTCGCSACPCSRRLVMANCMTASDLCSMYKPWAIQEKLVYVIMEEFWQQVRQSRTL